MATKTIRAKARVKNGLIDVKLLIKHPMETGLRKTKDGKAIPAKFIQEVMAVSGGKTVLKAEFNTAISKDPYLSFAFVGDENESVSIQWVDNTGDTDQLDVAVR